MSNNAIQVKISSLERKIDALKTQVDLISEENEVLRLSYANKTIASVAQQLINNVLGLEGVRFEAKSNLKHSSVSIKQHRIVGDGINDADREFLKKLEKGIEYSSKDLQKIFNKSHNAIFQRVKRLVENEVLIPSHNKNGVKKTFRLYDEAKDVF